MERTESKTKKLFTPQVIFLSILILLGNFSLGLFLGLRGHSLSPVKQGDWSLEAERKYASRLLSEGLVEEARTAYERFLERPGAPISLRANIYFSLGEAFLAKQKYEEALAYFFKAEACGVPEDVKRQMGLNIVTCFEKLGKSLDALSAMQERTALETEESESPRGEVVATIGNRMITIGEIHDRLNELPDFLQAQYKDEKQKQAFIHQYVINKVLLKKGLALQYHKDPKVRRQVEMAEESLIVQKVMQDTLAQDLKPEAYDLKNYYQAHLGKYKASENKEASPAPYEAVADQVKRDYLQEKGEQKIQSLITELFLTYDVQLHFKPAEADPALPQGEDDAPGEPAPALTGTGNNEEAHD